MGLVVPLVAGALCGLVAGVPYLASFAYVRRTHILSVLPGFAAIAVSLVVVVAGLAGAWVVAREVIVPFAFALVALFFVVVLVSAAWFLRVPRP